MLNVLRISWGGNLWLSGLKQISRAAAMELAYPATRAILPPQFRALRNCHEDISIYDEAKTPRNPFVVASADIDQIDGVILKWSNLAELWEGHKLYERYSFVSDVVEYCRSASVDRSEWDGGAPGQSGICCEVTSMAPKKLQNELRTRVQELIRESK